jgi:3-dehydroquinate synthase
LREIVWNSLSIKKAFIEEDELDRGRRNLLNYGHTFAHAYEAATHYAIPHGIAVTLGVVSANYFSEALGWLPEGTTANLLSWLRPYLGGFAPRLKAAQQGEIIDAMRRDKKNEGGEITFILTRGPGRMEKRPVAVAQARDLLADFIPSLS